jgi:allophanate hydrolase subunit 1
LTDEEIRQAMKLDQFQQQEAYLKDTKKAKQINIPELIKTRQETLVIFARIVVSKSDFEMLNAAHLDAVEQQLPTKDYWAYLMNLAYEFRDKTAEDIASLLDNSYLDSETPEAVDFRRAIDACGPTLKNLGGNQGQTKP